MKERPILFSTSMVQAILAGRKTMTRRIIKPQPDGDGLWNDDDFPRSLQSTLKNWNGQTEDGQSREWKCPYGKPGDRLWVRETFVKLVPEHFIDRFYVYKADSDSMTEQIRKEYIKCGYPYKYKPAIYMPRLASRITLEITNVRVERLQDISDEDAVKEGIEVIHMAEPTVPIYKRYDLKENKGTTNPFLSFQTLWKSINGKDSWDANPWVWVIEFQKING